MRTHQFICTVVQMNGSRDDHRRPHPTAAAGLLGLGAVVAIHEVAEIFVIANALRARNTGTFTAPSTDTRPNLAVGEHAHA